MRCTPGLRSAPVSGLLVLILLLVTDIAAARTWHIKVDGSGDLPTIQAGIDSAAPGDVVLVGPGTYTWSNQGGNGGYGLLYFPRGRDRFTLRSEAGPNATVLDAQRAGRVIFIQGLNGVTIEGFKITGGDAPAFGNFGGGGIICHLSPDIVRNCIFESNWAQQGGGIWCGGVSTIRLENCIFRYNLADYGGAMFFINSYSTQTIIGCTIDSNTASVRGGAIYGVSMALDISNTLMTRNSAVGDGGGALYLRSMHASSMTSCTLADNDAPDATVYLLDCPSFSVDRSILISNSAVAFTSLTGSVLTLSCSDIYGNTDDTLPAGSVDAGGNFSVNPVFCEGSQNYFIDSASPCAPGNHPDDASCDLIGALGVNCGQVKTEQRTWGQVKALYRR